MTPYVGLLMVEAAQTQLVSESEMVALLRSIDAQLSSIALWMPSDADTTTQAAILEEVQKTNELLEQILPALTAGKPNI